MRCHPALACVLSLGCEPGPKCAGESFPDLPSEFAPPGQIVGTFGQLSERCHCFNLRQLYVNEEYWGPIFEGTGESGDVVIYRYLTGPDDQCLSVQINANVHGPGDRGWPFDPERDAECAELFERWPDTCPLTEV